LRIAIRNPELTKYKIAPSNCPTSVKILYLENMQHLKEELEYARTLVDVPLTLQSIIWKWNSYWSSCKSFEENILANIRQFEGGIW